MTTSQKQLTPPRKRILRLMRKDSSATVTSMAEALRVSPTRIHQHIDALVEMGLVERGPRWIVKGTDDD